MKATLEGRPGEVIETLAAWEMFRRLGFEAENINVGIMDGNLIVQVHVQGKMPVLRIGRTNMTDETFQKHWNEIADLIPDVPEAELDTIWERSESRRRVSEVCQGLINAEIYWPEHPRFNATLQ